MTAHAPTTARAPRIALLGAGTMGEALLAGALDGGLAPEGVRVSARRQERLEELEGRYRVAGTTSSAEAVSEAELVVLAVLPEAVPDVLAGIREHLPGARAAFLAALV